MNHKKICFITCVNKDAYEIEEIKYIEQLIVPEGFEVEVLSIREAKSMASGYNEGMRASDAKYKVYLHQDVFILNRNFIADILQIFTDQSVGMIGMVGSPKLPENAIMWTGPRIGRLYYYMIFKTGEVILGDVDGAYQRVEAVDGLLMATQYDIPWREDLFPNWDFYDVSQSREFIEKGYHVVVPDQKTPWCFHDDGFFNLKNYYKSRRIFLEEYKNKKNE